MFIHLSLLKGQRMRYNIGLLGFVRWLLRMRGISPILNMRIGSRILAVGTSGHARYYLSVRTLLPDGKLLFVSQWSLPIPHLVSGLWQTESSPCLEKTYPHREQVDGCGEVRERETTQTRTSGDYTTGGHPEAYGNTLMGDRWSREDYLRGDGPW